MKDLRAVSEKFGSIMLYYRQQKGYSLKELSDLTGISCSYLNRLETGKRLAPSIPIGSKIAKALGISLATLLDISITDDSLMEAQTVSELLLYNDFKIVEDKVVSNEAKQILIDIIEFIVKACWAEETKVRDVFELYELVEDFKEEMKVR